MGEGQRIPPYAPHARYETSMAARRDDMLLRVRMLQDAENQEQLGRRALRAAFRQRIAAACLSLLAAIAAAALLSYSWVADDMTENGYMIASWALLGGTCALGVLYLATGSVRRAAQRREAGERLLKRAQRQRERAGGRQ